MSIRNHIVQATVLIMALSALILSANGFLIYTNATERYTAIAEQVLDATNEIYKDEIIGNILVGDLEVLQALLDEASRKRKVTLTLTTDAGEIHSGDLRSMITRSYPLLSGREKLANLTVGVDSKGILTLLLNDMTLSILLCSLLLVLALYVFRELMARRLLRPLSCVVESLNANTLATLEVDPRALSEIHQLSGALKQMSEKIAQQAKFEGRGQVADQVSHDIRSPLSALQMVVHDLPEMSEEKRLLIRGSINRIRDIANALLKDSLKKETPVVTTPPTQPSAAGLTIELLPSLIDSLLSEKRMQYRARIGLTIESNFDASSYGVFAKMNAVEFGRALSNLIDNAAESIEGPGNILISLRAEQYAAVLEIQDNGSGIPAEILPKLGRRGETFGKIGGSGLGIYQAKQAIQSWAGQLKIFSEVEKGTCVQVRLPLAKAPDWFVPELPLEAGQRIVILDDDASIHQVWNSRFEPFVSDLKLALEHASTSSELRGVIELSRRRPPKKVTYLFDYELLGDTTTGLSLIEDLGIGEDSILVTSRYEEHKIRERCRQLRVRLIPKAMAAFVPIRA